MSWFSFADLHGGGSRKTDWEIIVIEANDESDAITRFEQVIGINPYQVSCACCGKDFGWSEVKDFNPSWTWAKLPTTRIEPQPERGRRVM